MKIPKIEKLPSGNYFCRLRINGVSIPITAETESECELLATLKKAELLSGKSHIQRTPKETTLQEAIDKYLRANKATLSPSTYRAYSIYARNRFPKYRKMKLSKINWQEMVDEELEHAAEKTVKNAWSLVAPALRHAGYPVPKVRLSQVPVTEIPFLQPEEIPKFCAEVRGKKYEIPALLALQGLRLSELRGLNWSNVDLDKKTITISGAVVQSVSGDVAKRTNKNDTSARTVPIMIDQLYNALNAVQDKTGPVVKIKGCSLLDDVKRSCDRAGITQVTTHGLRHSFASLCFFLKIPEKQIEQWGGWKNSIVLHRIYIRLSAQMESENKGKFSSFFNGKSTGNSSPVQS